MKIANKTHLRPTKGFVSFIGPSFKNESTFLNFQKLPLEKVYSCNIFLKIWKVLIYHPQIKSKAILQKKNRHQSNAVVLYNKSAIDVITLLTMIFIKLSQSCMRSQFSKNINASCNQLKSRSTEKHDVIGRKAICIWSV